MSNNVTVRSNSTARPCGVASHHYKYGQNHETKRLLTKLAGRSEETTRRHRAIIYCPPRTALHQTYFSSSPVCSLHLAFWYRLSLPHKLWRDFLVPCRAIPATNAHSPSKRPAYSSTFLPQTPSQCSCITSSVPRTQRQYISHRHGLGCPGLRFFFLLCNVEVDR